MRLQPIVDQHLMFGWDVKQWKLLFAQRGHAIFYGITPKGLSPAQIFSLNFEQPNMFSYLVGGDAEELTAGVPQYKDEVRRIATNILLLQKAPA